MKRLIAYDKCYVHMHLRPTHSQSLLTLIIIVCKIGVPNELFDYSFILFKIGIWIFFIPNYEDMRAVIQNDKNYVFVLFINGLG
jgi:hypothetical protein